MTKASWIAADYMELTGSVDQWKQEVQMIIDCNDGGHPIEVTMKLWADSTAAERQAWRDFGQASFLIANVVWN